MEVKLVQEFDYSDKNTIFEKMDCVSDGIIKEIRESGNSVFVTLHQFNLIQGPDGEIIWPYLELEIECVYANKKDMDLYDDITLYGKKWDKSYDISSLSDLPALAKRDKIELELDEWMIGWREYFSLLIRPSPIYNHMTKKFVNSKSKIRNIRLDLGHPQKIIYRWKA